MSTRRTPSDTAAGTREHAQRAGEGGELSEITTAIEARQAQIIQLQSDIETLQRAASIMGWKD